MSVNDASRIIIGDSRVMLKIVASHADDSRGIFYDYNMLIVQANECGIWVTRENSNQKENELPLVLYCSNKTKLFN
jgi:hypothetical protein